jgi:hypothetical protein
MVVLESHLKKGIGDLLIKYCEAYSEKWQSDLIWLNSCASVVSYNQKVDCQIVGVSIGIIDFLGYDLMVKSTCNE